MDASHLTPEQGRQFAECGYVHRLAHRVQRMGWKPDDPMYVAAWDAHEALHVRARYASCEPGTGADGRSGRAGVVGESIKARQRIVGQEGGVDVPR